MMFMGKQEWEVKVADVGPLLVLKLNGFGGPTRRRVPKDAYDTAANAGIVDSRTR
jgi:hypothetical protein